jgi:hypothetical protein
MVSFIVKPSSSHPIELFSHNCHEFLGSLLERNELQEYSNPIDHLELSVAGCIAYCVLDHIRKQELLEVPFVNLSVSLSAKRIVISVTCSAEQKNAFEELIHQCFICSLLKSPPMIRFNETS